MKPQMNEGVGIGECFKKRPYLEQTCPFDIPNFYFSTFTSTDNKRIRHLKKQRSTIYEQGISPVDDTMAEDLIVSLGTKYSQIHGS